MSSTQEGSSAASGSSRKAPASRRSWTFAEEQTLVAAVKALVPTKMKAENGFKPGYLKLLEDALVTADPKTDLRAHPHITSKLSVWKKQYSSLASILNRSGVGFNDKGTHMIVCEEEQWQQIVKADPSARGMRYKMWPLYDDWKELFGTDRANGENAEDASEAWIDMQKDDPHSQPVDLGFEHDCSFENDHIDGTQEKSSETVGDERRTKRNGRAKKAKVHNEVHGICELLESMNDTTNARLDKLAMRIGYDIDVSQARQDAFEQIGEIPGLSLADQFTVCELVCFNDRRMDMWRGMKPAARAQYVAHLLSTRN